MLMVKTGYSYKPSGPNGKAYGRDLPISAKDAREVASAIRNKKVLAAEQLFDDVLDGKAFIQFKRYNQELAHRKKIGPARQPINTVKEFAKVLRNAKENAKSQGLAEANLVVTHISAHKALHKRPRGARAFSKGPQRRSRRTNLEIIVEERK